jgi:hypothetical protein
MKAIVSVLLVLSVSVLAQSPSATRMRRSSGPAGGPTTLVTDPRFPTAGTILGTLPTPTSCDPPTFSAGIWEADYDLVRNTVWLVEQVPSPATGGNNIFGVDPGSRSVVTSFSFQNLNCTGGGRGFLNGASGVTVTRDLNLLVADYNGDLAVLDDHMAELDPLNPVAVINAWRLDSTSCPASCAPNGNTNTPRVSIDQVTALANVNSRTSDPVSSQTFLIAAFGTAAPDPLVRVVELTPGCPGTWFQRGTFIIPGCNEPSGLDWDAALQRLWAIDGSTGTGGMGNSIYEVAYNRATNTPSVVQSWPTPSSEYSVWVAGIDDADFNLNDVWAGSYINNKVLIFDSGHTGQGFMSFTALPGLGQGTITLTEDPGLGALSYIAAASFGPAPVGLDVQNNRDLFLNVDNLLLLTLTIPNAPPVYTGFQGTFTNPSPNPTPTNPPVASIQLNAPPLRGVPIAVAFVTFEGSPGGRTVLGIQGYSAPFTFTLP